MAKKKRGRPSDADDAPVKLPKAPEKLARPFETALRAVGRVPLVTEPTPQTMPPPGPTPPERAPRSDSPPRNASGERALLHQALRGVVPLSAASPKEARRVGPRATVPPPASDEAKARRDLATLVSGGVRFDVRVEADHVVGVRVGTSAKWAATLQRLTAVDETLDLHGSARAEVEARVSKFVRASHQRGDRVLLIVHGKGNHSEGGLGVLRDATIEALTEGGAAILVKAFVTAKPALGGTGALLVGLVDRV